MTQNAIGTEMPIQVAKGGTGAATLTDHGVLLGSGANAITPTAEGGTGTVLIGTTGADASFSATPTLTSVSFGDESLDSYDEGTFTPVLKFGGGTTGITYATQTGRYTRIGDLVIIDITIILTSKGSSGGAAQITGLPITSGVTSVQNVSAWETVNLDGGFYSITAVVGATGTLLDLQQEGDGVNFNNITNASIANTSELYLSYTYKA